MKKLLTIISVLVVVVMATVLLMACVPSSMEKAKDKLEKAGFSVESMPIDIQDLSEGAVDALLAIKSLGSGYLFATLFDSEASAKAVYDEYLADSEEFPFIVKQSGKWLYLGDEEGIKAFE